MQLPLKIDIIKHPSEVDGKSTSAHAKVLAPDDVSIYTYPCIPDYPRDGSVRHYKGGVMGVSQPLSTIFQLGVLNATLCDKVFQ